MKRLLIVLSIMLTILACNIPSRIIVPATESIQVPAAQTLTPEPTKEPIAYPFPQHVTYAPSSMLPSHRTQAQLDDDVRAFYDQWKSEFLIEAGMDANGS